MSETEGQEEPTMEEILASIRKIISEDDVEETEEVTAKATAEPEPAPEPEIVLEPEPEPEPEPALEEDDQVLELTEELDEDDLEEFEAEPEADPEFEPESEPEPVIEMDNGLAIDDVEPASGGDILMSEKQSGFAMDQFGVLSDLLTSGYQGSGNTLEDLVREMLKPMLREWLDKNLPPVVERMVAKEIARLSRTKKP